MDVAVAVDGAIPHREVKGVGTVDAGRIAGDTLLGMPLVGRKGAGARVPMPMGWVEGEMGKKQER